MEETVGGGNNLSKVDCCYNKWLEGGGTFIIFTLAIDFLIFWLFQQSPSRASSTSASPHEPSPCCLGSKTKLQNLS